MLRMRTPSLSGRRVLITGAARGIGAALARRLHRRGARVLLTGLEPELLAKVAAECGDAPWLPADVADRAGLSSAVDDLAETAGGLDAVVANAGIACQWPILTGDPAVLEKTLQVNVLGTYNTLRAAGPHLAHPRGYALVVASLAAAVRAPLLGAYSSSKAAVEALGDTLRVELRPTGAKVGVAYFAELDTDMTHRGFDTRAVAAMRTGGSTFTGITPLKAGIDALENGMAWRSRRIYAPRWVGPVLPARDLAQRVFELVIAPSVPEAVRLASEENPPFTTPQP